MTVDYKSTLVELESQLRSAPSRARQRFLRDVLGEVAEPSAPSSQAAGGENLLQLLRDLVSREKLADVREALDEVAFDHELAPPESDDAIIAANIMDAASILLAIEFDRDFSLVARFFDHVLLVREAIGDLTSEELDQFDRTEAHRYLSLLAQRNRELPAVGGGREED